MARVNGVEKRKADEFAARVHDALVDEGVDLLVIPGTRWDHEPYGKIVIEASMGWSSIEFAQLIRLLEANGFYPDNRWTCVLVYEAS